MYAGHDMSTHEVVVRSLLEVLQEFDDAIEGDRTVRGTGRFVAFFCCAFAGLVLFFLFSSLVEFVHFVLTCRLIAASCSSVFVD